ncbi:MAG: alpha/beta hydrolase [Aggregatilineales bacterium]
MNAIGIQDEVRETSNQMEKGALMQHVISKDGTKIAYEKSGNGAALILVDGAFGTRKFGPNGDLAKLLTEHFTVYTYDRRGRGDSGDTPPYTVEREVEDLDALIQVAGGSVLLYGISSGAGLALEAARQGLSIKKLAIFEAPYFLDDSRAPLPADYMAQMRTLTKADKRGDLVKLFMTKGVGVPAIFVFMMRFMPAWSKLKSVAHTVLYDSMIVEPYQHGKPLSPQEWASVSMPTLVTVGGKSPDWMRNGMQSLAETLPDAKLVTLPGQTHIVKVEALAPELINFLRA